MITPQLSAKSLSTFGPPAILVLIVVIGEIVVPEHAVRLLFTYGPAALLVFLVIVAEPKARNFYGETKHKAGIFVIVTIWMSIFALTAVIAMVWIDSNQSPCGAIIRGRLIGLDATEEMKSPFEALYLQRVYGAKSRFDFVWLIATKKKIPAGTPVDLYLNRGSPEREDLTVYELPIASDFYDPEREVTLSYDRQKRRLLLRGVQGVTALNVVSPEATLFFPRLRRKSQFNLRLVHLADAQPPDDLRSLSTRLQSDDPVIRVQARSDLAQMGQSALPYVEEVLTTNSSSYRLRLGAIVALNSMAKFKPDSLSPQANCSVVQASHGSDPYLREQAGKYVAEHPTLEIPEHCKGPTGSECEDITRTRIHLHQIIQPEGTNAYFYLAGISSSDVADLYFINAPSGTFKTDSEIGGKTLKRRLIGYSAATGTALNANSYTRRKLRRNEYVQLTLGTEGLRVTVTETHVFKDFAVLEVCLGAPGP